MLTRDPFQEDLQRLVEQRRSDSNVHDAIVEMARRHVSRCLDERELLVAKFITENPDLPADQIEIVERRHPDGTLVISVGVKQC